MAYGAGAFAQGLMSGLQTGFELADVRKQKKREKIAAEIAKGKVPADGVATFDANELAQQERLNPTLASGMSGDQLSQYASTRRVPLNIEQTQELGNAPVNLGGLPMPGARPAPQAPAIMPKAALAANQDELPEIVATGHRQPKMDWTKIPTAADEVAAPQYQKYTDMLGRERFTTKLRDRSKEEIAFDTATRLQQMGDQEGYDKYMQRYDAELERGSKVRAKNLMESSQTLQAGILLNDSGKVNKGLSGIMNTLQNNPDGMTWNLQRSPNGNELVLSAIDTATGLPAPPQVKGYPAGTMAVFKADPSAGMTAEQVMAVNMTALAKGDWGAVTKSIMEGRKAVADIHQSEASARLSNVNADLAPQELSLKERYQMGMLGVNQFEAQTGRMNAVSNRISALGTPSAATAKDLKTWNAGVNGYVAKVMSESGLQPGTPEFAKAAADARNGAIQVYGPPPGTKFFTDKTPSAASGSKAPTAPKAPAAPAPNLDQKRARLAAVDQQIKALTPGQVVKAYGRGGQQTVSTGGGRGGAIERAKLQVERAQLRRDLGMKD